jgi:hypothetical protein
VVAALPDDMDPQYHRSPPRPQGTHITTFQSI